MRFEQCAVPPAGEDFNSHFATSSISPATMTDEAPDHSCSVTQGIRLRVTIVGS